MNDRHSPDRFAARGKSRVSTKLCPKEREMIFRFGIIASVIFAGLFVVAQDVKTDYDRNYNFAQLHTFAIKIGTSWGNPLSEERVKDEVAKALVKRGWSQTD